MFFLHKDTLEFETGLDLRKLTLLGNVLLHKDTLEFEIAQRQLAIKSIDSNSWFVDCNCLLYKYSLPSIYHVIGHIESPEDWRALLKKHVDFYMSVFDLTTRVTRVENWHMRNCVHVYSSDSSLNAPSNEQNGGVLQLLMETIDIGKRDSVLSKIIMESTISESLLAKM